MTAREGDIERLLANRWTHGKSATRYPYTVQTVARATRRAEGTVRNDIAHSKLEMESLVSVAYYIHKHVERLGQ